ncbi:MAG: glycosyltransferase [Dysgonomonas sp.]|nr:glycosyltransferase [Dysgonomonas sp.]
MGKFLFIVPPLAGHVNPTLGLGAKLLERGHQVGWISFDPALGQKIPEDADFLLLESDIDEAEKEKIKNELIEVGKQAVYGLDSLKFLYEKVLIPMNSRMLEGVRRLIDDYQPDVIINDQQIFAGSVAAIQKNIPYVTSVTAPAAIKVNEALPKIYEWEGQQVISFQKENGISENVRLDCSLLLTLVYTSEKFFGNNTLSDSFKFIGPTIERKEIIDDFAWEKLEDIKDRPKILISLGTTFDHTQKSAFFSKIVEAFEQEEILVVVISDPTLFEHIPDNFIVRKQIPQLKVIPMMDAVVCHGGNNTVCEALSYAKPLVVLPIAYDQSYVAGCVVDSGSGIRLNFNRFRSSQLRDAVYKVLEEDGYKNNAELVRKSFMETGGVDKALDYLEEILMKK